MHPGLVTFDDDENFRSNRANLALLLHVPPSVIDEMSLQDIQDVFARHNANTEIRNEQMKRR